MYHHVYFRQGFAHRHDRVRHPIFYERVGVREGLTG